MKDVERTYPDEKKFITFSESILGPDVNIILFKAINRIQEN